MSSQPPNPPSSDDPSAAPPPAADPGDPGRKSIHELLDPSTMEAPKDTFRIEPKAIRRNRILGVAQLVGLAVVLAAISIAAAALTKDKGPPSAKLLSEMSSQLDQPELSFSYELTAEAEVTTDQELLQSLSESANTTVSGTVVREAGGDVAVSANGGDWEFRLIGDAVYVREAQTWRGYALAPIKSELSGEAEAEAPAAGAESTESGLALADLFSEKSYAGPVVGGVQTWEMGKKIDPTKLPAAGNLKADGLADAISYSLSVGRRDHLPRQLEFSLAGDPGDWTLAPLQTDTTVDLKATVTMSDWGRAQRPVAPAGVSLEESLPGDYQLALTGLQYMLG